MTSNSESLDLTQKSKLPITWLWTVVISIVGLTMAWARIDNKSDAAAKQSESAIQSIGSVEIKMDGIINRLNSIDSRLSRIEGSLERGRK